VCTVRTASSKLTDTGGNTDRSRGSRADHADGGDGDEYDLGEGVHVEVVAWLVGVVLCIRSKGMAQRQLYSCKRAKNLVTLLEEPKEPQRASKSHQNFTFIVTKETQRAKEPAGSILSSGFSQMDKVHDGIRVFGDERLSIHMVDSRAHY
jgi:hypothetical protein